MSWKMKAEQKTWKKIGDAMDELAAYKVDVSHQELSRIIKELEDFCEMCPSDTWIAVEAAANWLCQQLGYGDYDELEDALHGSLENFLTELPHFDVKKPAPEDTNESVRFRSNLRDNIPGRPCKITFSVENSGDLWVVMLKPKGSWIEIPELEFEIGRGDARQVDTLYNIIGEAIFHLGTYLQNNHGIISTERFDGIYQTIHQLNGILDVEKPFTWIVHDPTGTCTFKPYSDKVKVEYTDLETIHE
jgi:hypothetical protein